MTSRRPAPTAKGHRQQPVPLAAPETKRQLRPLAVDRLRRTPIRETR